MQFGYHMMTRGATSGPDAIATVARACERVGFTYFGVSDHVVAATTINSAYPYSKDGSWAGASEGHCLETLATLSYIAAHTNRIRLLSSVMVIPHRPAVFTAKALATVDVLSKGRLTVGIGVGWMREELAALGAPPYERRGAASDEYLDAFKALWTQDVVNFDGEFVNFSGVVCEPKPVQRPGPPIWVGGEGAVARRRTAERGDGWYPVSRNPKQPLDTVDRFRAAVRDVYQRAETNGRDPASIQIALFAPHSRLGDEVHEDGQRLAFTGSADTLVDDIGAFEEAGLQVLLPNFQASSVERSVELCESFAEAVGVS
ncbi:MAG: LLM class F420-dependent oxidoreductase [Chromatiales bacterium]|jgi:probable F420-dependent oxidoreductase|nr:LLM class F420-dependent oxidoreductase [Chromatiales bacterium]